MDRPRIGDTILDGTMTPHEALGHGKNHVVGQLSNGKVRRFRLADLECIDHNEGLWQEYSPRARP
jgi:hypothetical protein